MDIVQWQQLAEVKAGILDVASALTDGCVDQSKCAATLVELSRKVHELENVFLFKAGN